MDDLKTLLSDFRSDIAQSVKETVASELKKRSLPIEEQPPTKQRKTSFLVDLSSNDYDNSDVEDSEPTNLNYSSNRNNGHQ